ncbi:MAG: ABC-2 family transporter protein [Anaerolineae bacterium]|nr:ABC-2 family transporter protein [Anaerolineae bacterium]
MLFFWKLIALSFQRQLAYRGANWAGLATNFFFGLLRASIMISLFQAQGEISGLSLQDAITYTGLTQAVIAYLNIFGWWEVIHAVYSGDIASDLLKPLDYFTFWLAQDLGRAIAQMLVRGITIMLAYAVFFPLTLPGTVTHWLALIASLLLSLLISFEWRFLVNLAAFWTPDARGIGRTAFSLALFLSGFLMPLRFFPAWFVRLCHLTPFPALINSVVEIYLGGIEGVDLLRALGFQLLWAIILFALCQIILRQGVRKLVIQGG